MARDSRVSRTVVLIAALIAFFVFWNKYASADKEAPSYTQFPAQSPTPTSTEQIIDILLSQGVAGVGLIVLAWWIKTSTAQARADRLRIEERVFNLVDKTNSNLAGQQAELENISRELERLRS